MSNSSNRVAVYPGSFDPITLGHLDLIQRGLRLFDRLVIGVGVNSQKTPMFAGGYRCQLIEAALRGYGDIVQIDMFEGMLGDFARQVGANFVLRGMRTLSDFDFEFQIAYANQAMFPDLETVFVATDPKLSAVSSSLVRELLRRKGDLGTLRKFVPGPVADLLTARY